MTLHPKQLVFAMGIVSEPFIPSFPGSESFEEVSHHSSRHRGSQSYRNKKAVVIGANTSAHDICADLWEHGAHVTMVQRSSTLVVRSDPLMKDLGRLYSEEAVAAGMTIEKADLTFGSIPLALLPLL